LIEQRPRGRIADHRLIGLGLRLLGGGELLAARLDRLGLRAQCGEQVCVDPLGLGLFEAATAGGELAAVLA
jgi:hypothetical protein